MCQNICLHHIILSVFIADENYEENELNNVPIDNELDLGNLSSGLRQPILKISRFLITTYMYINIINKIFKNV